MEFAGLCHIEPFIDCIRDKLNLKELKMMQLSNLNMVRGMVASQAQLTTFKSTFGWRNQISWFMHSYQQVVQNLETIHS